MPIHRSMLTARFFSAAAKATQSAQASVSAFGVSWQIPCKWLILTHSRPPQLLRSRKPANRSRRPKLKQ